MLVSYFQWLSMLLFFSGNRTDKFDILVLTALKMDIANGNSIKDFIGSMKRLYCARDSSNIDEYTLIATNYTNFNSIKFNKTNS